MMLRLEFEAPWEVDAASGLVLRDLVGSVIGPLLRCLSHSMSQMPRALLTLLARRFALSQYKHSCCSSKLMALTLKLFEHVRDRNHSAEALSPFMSSLDPASISLCLTLFFSNV